MKLHFLGKTYSQLATGDTNMTFVYLWQLTNLERRVLK